jgi:hypothetical protein
MDEHFVQGIVGGVLSRHKGKTLDKDRIQTLMIEIAANIDVAHHYTDVKGLAKDNPLSIEMWKGYTPNKFDVDEEKFQSQLSKEYLDYWKCDMCGKHTHEVDYDYLSGTNHLECALKHENAYKEYLDKPKKKKKKESK